MQSPKREQLPRPPPPGGAALDKPWEIEQWPTFFTGSAPREKLVAR